MALCQVEILRSAIEYITKLENMLQSQGKMTKIMAANQGIHLPDNDGQDYVVSFNNLTNQITKVQSINVFLAFHVKSVTKLLLLCTC